MNTKKAILLGIALWVLIFFEVSILIFGLKLRAPDDSYADPVYYGLHFLFFSLFVILLGIIYFREKKIKKGFLEGLLLGIMFVIVGIILDSLITIPLFKNKDYSFLLQREIVFSEIWGVILLGIVGWIKRR